MTDMVDWDDLYMRLIFIGLGLVALGFLGFFMVAGGIILNATFFVNLVYLGVFLFFGPIIFLLLWALAIWLKVRLTGRAP